MPSRFEAGFHFALIDERAAVGEKPLGYGGGFTYRLTRFVALDSAVNRYPLDGQTSFPVTQALVGIRAGIKIGGVGLYGKIRPGFLRYDETLFGSAIGTKPNLDVGGVLEFYSSRHIGVRFDMGRSIVFYGNNPIAAPLGPRTPGTSNQLQCMFGIFAHF